MAATYTRITSTTLTSNQSSITFSSISGAYTDLVLISSVRDTRPETYAYPALRFNSDTGSNYSRTAIYGDGSSAASNRASNQTNLQYCEAAGASQATGNYAPIITNILNYSNTTTNKIMLSRMNNTAGTGGYQTGTIVGLWRNTSAITSITIIGDPGASSSLATGSTFTLYGIKAGS